MELKTKNKANKKLEPRAKVISTCYLQQLQNTQDSCCNIVILTWRENKPDHKGASSRARLLNCTSPGLTLGINSIVEFLVVGISVLAFSLQSKFEFPVESFHLVKTPLLKKNEYQNQMNWVRKAAEIEL